MMKKLAPLSLLFACVFFTGCPSYDAVRNLSAEQLRAQEQLLKNQKAYYAAIDKLLDQQVLVAKARLDAITAEQVKLINDKMADDLSKEPDPKKHPAIIAKYTKMVSDASADTSMKKQQIDAHVQLIKDKHKEIAQAYDDMYAAQVELNRYIQLKKVDEVIADQVSSRFKLDQGVITNALDKVAAESESLRKLLP